MAQVPYSPVADVAPDVRSPDDYFRIQSSPDMFGGLLAKGLEQAGAGASKASVFFGQVAADDASNNFQDFANKLLHGDPQKTITGPDGQPQQDTGYLGLKGRAALDARPGVESQLDQYLKSARGNLTSAEQQLQFDNFSRRYRSYVAGQIGTHADDQSQLWFQQVNKSSSDLALQHIAADPDNPNQVAAGASDLINARVKTAMLLGAQPGDPAYQDAVQGGKRDALKMQVEAIGVRDPARALKILDSNRDLAGTDYPELAGKLQERADQQVGLATGQKVWQEANAGRTGTITDPRFARYNSYLNSGDVQSALRLSEGLRTNAYWDVNHWRTGYGSDTVTRADGTVESVTATTQITPEDAERDLQRRTGLAATQAQGQIGPAAWGALSAGQRAALTSVVYNYGHLPQDIAAAGASGDREALARAIAAHAGDNNGVNSQRRLAEAGAVMGTFGLAGVMAAPAPMNVGAPGAPRVESDLAPTLSPPEEKAAAFQRILDDQTLSPKAQETALAYVNRQYSIVETETAGERQTLEQSVPNLIAAVEQGVEGVSIPFERINAVMPPAKAKAWADEYAIAQDVGTAMRSLRWSSPADVAAMQRDIESGEGILSEAMRARRREPTEGPGVAGANPDAVENQAMEFRLRQGMAKQFENQVNARQQLLNGPNADPAAYVADHPMVKRATAALDAKNTASFSAYAAATLGVQKALGVANPQILTRDQVETISRKWSDPNPEGGATAIAADMEREANAWGDNWPEVYREIAPKGDSLIRVVAAGVDGTAARDLLQARGVSDDELLKGAADPDTKKADVSAAVSTALKPLATTLAGAERSQTLADLQKVGERLALLRLAERPGDAGGAAASAVNDLVNFKYDYVDSFRLPKALGIPTATIQAGAAEAKALLGDGTALAPPGSTDGPLAIRPNDVAPQAGLSPQYVAAQTAEGLRYNGVWLTDPREDGLILVRPTGYPAMRADGRPLTLTWAQLAALGQQAAARGAGAVNQGLNALP